MKPGWFVVLWPTPLSSASKPHYGTPSPPLFTIKAFSPWAQYTAWISWTDKAPGTDWSEWAVELAKQQTVAKPRCWVNKIVSFSSGSCETERCEHNDTFRINRLVCCIAAHWFECSIIHHDIAVVGVLAFSCLHINVKLILPKIAVSQRPNKEAFTFFFFFESALVFINIS